MFLTWEFINILSICKVNSISRVPTVVVVMLRLWSNNGTHWKSFVIFPKSPREHSLYEPHAYVAPEHLVDPVLKLVKLMISYPIDQVSKQSTKQIEITGV